MRELPFREFNATEHETWCELYNRQTPLRSQQIVPLFEKGLHDLGITGDRIPDLQSVNRKLEARTGFTGVPVEGLEEGSNFFSMLQDRKFPIGNFIRDRRDLNYTPAPDIFHDLYGHIPFFIDQRYADFCQRFGARAMKEAHVPNRMREYERLFWFTIEFALLETSAGRRILGAGIASSFGECRYALSPEPEVIPFEESVVRAQEFRIDTFQKKLFVLSDIEELYSLEI